MNNTFYLGNYTLNNNLVPQKKMMVGIIGAALFLFVFSLIALFVSWRATHIRKRLRTSQNSKKPPTAAVKVINVIAPGKNVEGGLKSKQLPKPVSDIDVELESEYWSSQSFTSIYDDNYHNNKFREEAKSSSLLSGSSEFLNSNLAARDFQRCDRFHELEDGDNHLNGATCPCQLNSTAAAGISSSVSDAVVRECENESVTKMKPVTTSSHCFDFLLCNEDLKCSADAKQFHVEENKPIDVQRFAGLPLSLQPITQPLQINTNLEKPADLQVVQEIENPKLHQIEFRIEIEPLATKKTGLPFKANFLSDLAETKL